MPLTADDIIEIHQLHARYCFALDDGDGAAVADCFTIDGVIDTTVRGVFSGREAIGLTQTEGEPWDPAVHLAHDRTHLMRHMVTNIDVTGDGDRATSRAYITVVSSGSGTPQLLFTGRFDADELERTPDGWKIKYRRVTPDVS